MYTVYLLHGDNEALLSIAASDALAVLKRQHDDAVVYDLQRDEKISNRLHATSLFSETEIFVLRGLPSTKDGMKELLDYLNEPSQDNILFIVTPKITPSLKKAVQEANGRIKSVVGKTYKDTATTIVSSTDLQLSASSKHLIMEHYGQDVENIPALLKTLREVHGTDRVINPDDISAYLDVKGSVPVWDLTDAIDAANTAKALSTVDRLLRSSSPQSILTMLSLHVEKMFRLQQSGITEEHDAAAFLGLKGSTYPAKKALQTLKRYGSSLPELATIVAKANVDVRGGSPVPDRIILEVTTARLCTYPRKS